jgi:hypothetical protein
VRLENATKATFESINDGELPQLDVFVRELLTSTFDMHGAFMLCTRAGMELIAAEERYRRRPEEEEEFRDAAMAFAHELQDQPDVIDPEAAAFVLQASEDLAAGPHSQRTNVVESGAIRNTSIVIVAGATIAAMPVAGAILAGVSGTILGTLAALIGFEGLKKSKPFGTVSGTITRHFDSLADADVQKALDERSHHLAPHLQFILRTEPLLRRLAGQRSQFQWLRTSLDWLKSHATIVEK